MVEIYGYIKKDGFAIGDEYKKILIGAYSKEMATRILNNGNFIKRWNDNHIEKLDKISIEITAL